MATPAHHRFPLRQLAATINTMQNDGTEAKSTSRDWLSPAARTREREIRTGLDFHNEDAVDDRLFALVERNRQIHDQECINLNPASNVMNPRAEALLAAGLSTRASLGHAGDKYEMGLEAIEEIEVIAAELAKTIFNAAFAEIRVGSGALANLYAFMAACEPGDSILVPPAEIGGHVTHRTDGAAGLYKLKTQEYPIDAQTFSVDIDGLARQAKAVRPKLITVGTSLNLLPHPVAEIRAIADDVGALVLFDGAHACGMFAGGVWPNPLDEGAHILTMSTYKSLGGPAGGLALTNDHDLAERIDGIAYPGLTANFDVGVTAALALSLLDWSEFGHEYATTMAVNALRLASELDGLGIPMFRTGGGFTTSHQLAADASQWGGGHHGALLLREANILASAIGLPGDESAGLRFGTPEITRIGMVPSDMAELATVIADGLDGRSERAAVAASEMRQRFDSIHFTRTYAR